jgi:hypothetical protein
MKFKGERMYANCQRSNIQDHLVVTFTAGRSFKRLHSGQIHARIISSTSINSSIIVFWLTNIHIHCNIGVFP